MIVADHELDGRCRIPKCGRRAPSGRLMCGPHWKRVPRDLQRDVWRAFKPEQLKGTPPTAEYLAAAKAAIDAAKRALPAHNEWRRHKPKTKSTTETAPDWTGTCGNCGATPIVPATGMCGPCSTGEADTVAGNW